MNIKFLETFVWVARLKSFRLTAEKLFTTQASISSRIAALEDEMGVRLFVRDSKGVSLTSEGQRVLEYAERIMDTMQSMKAVIKDPRQVRGRIRIGAMDTVIHTWLSPLVTRLMECYPALEIELSADTASNLCSQLEKGYQDIIFQTDILRLDSVRNALLTRYPMHWVVRTGSAYDRAYGSLEDLSQERIVTFSRNSRPHQDILNLLHSANIVSPRINCVNSASAITRLVRDGFGIGAMPAALVVGELAQGTLTLVEGVPLPSVMDIVASWRTGAGMERVEDIVSLTREVVGEFVAQLPVAYRLAGQDFRGL
ncbi:MULTISPECIES: LysR family transcriptional regulator [unclassified Pseudomonas]|uniref:LysR family transcriptional regulator n=1 Tax=unclassified Pseudomonas TaxID=196821 RepID=UPI00088039AE|nr:MULTISPECIES: LysR family transcriptional regulator [unclassified Pseudomonas]SCX77353.1 DNA-binding transcriptional regulator, LysR family [Pseudomonas sp. NFACC37-1]SFN86304.1 DNA-binding transcriptional regulator, LysR family [Pseudomonas sp. NFACC24-1]